MRRALAAAIHALDGRPILAAGRDAEFWCESYGLLRDAICEHLEPCDDDVAEEAILIKAVELAGKRLKDNRRHVLGQAQDAIRENCGACDGHGFTVETRTGSRAEHHPSCDGDCTHLCPVEVPIQHQEQVQCEYCGRPIAEIQKLIDQIKSAPPVSE